MILLDTSALIDSITGPRRSGPALRLAFTRGERVHLPTLVLYEWLRGPRLPGEVTDQEELFPAESAIPFGPLEAGRAADLYRQVPAPRGRELALAIAACALCWEARLWTLNLEDFQDLPGLLVERPRPR